jgi:hypothetical protein
LPTVGLGDITKPAGEIKIGEAQLRQARGEETEQDRPPKTKAPLYHTNPADDKWFQMTSNSRGWSSESVRESSQVVDADALVQFERDASNRATSRRTPIPAPQSSRPNNPDKSSSTTSTTNTSRNITLGRLDSEALSALAALLWARCAELSESRPYEQYTKADLIRDLLPQFAALLELGVSNEQELHAAKLVRQHYM